MDYFDHSMKTARECGSYKAIASMMADAIRKLDAAEAGSIEAEYTMMSLRSLAEQFAETEEKFKKEVDNFSS
jgi:hypothetical protein